MGRKWGIYRFVYTLGQITDLEEHVSWPSRSGTSGYLPHHVHDFTSVRIIKWVRSAATSPMKVVKPKGVQLVILGLRGCTQVLNGIKFNRDTDLSGIMEYRWCLRWVIAPFLGAINVTIIGQQRFRFIKYLIFRFLLRHLYENR